MNEVPLDNRLRVLIAVFVLWVLAFFITSFVLQYPRLHVDATPDPAKMPGKRHEEKSR